MSNTDQTTPEAAEQVRSGQKLVINAILINIVTIIANMVVPNDSPLSILIGLASLGAIVASIIGIVRMSGGMGFGTGAKILFCLLSIIPLISIITLIILNTKATTLLRSKGYKVGFLGADPLQA